VTVLTLRAYDWAPAHRPEPSATRTVPLPPRSTA